MTTERRTTGRAERSDWYPNMVWIPAIVMVSGCASINNDCSTEGRAEFSGRPGMVRTQPVGWQGPTSQCQDDKECRRADDFGQAAIPGPPGTYVRPWNDAMICSARKSRFLFARHEWFSGGLQPGPEGRMHLNHMAIAMQQSPHQVVVEEETTLPGYDESYEEALVRTAALNAQRRTVVIQFLESAGVADAEQRVWLSSVERVGVYGAEAPGAYNRLIFGGNQQVNQNQGGGIGGAMGSGGSGGGNFSGGGFF